MIASSWVGTFKQFAARALAVLWSARRPARERASAGQAWGGFAFGGALRHSLQGPGQVPSVTDGQCPHCERRVAYEAWIPLVDEPDAVGCPHCHRATKIERIYPTIELDVPIEEAVDWPEDDWFEDHVPSPQLRQQIEQMLARGEDWIPGAHGIDESTFIVVNDFAHGVWLCRHHGHCATRHFTRLQRLA